MGGAGGWVSQEIRLAFPMAEPFRIGFHDRCLSAYPSFNRCPQRRSHIDPVETLKFLHACW